MNISATASMARPGRWVLWGALLLGFALGGFFDGILLHQVLQWHHLLSAVDSAAVQEQRVQMLADGLFHLLMYGVALLALWMLWTAPRASGAAGAGFLVAHALVGFGSWHVVDAVVSHWLLGIHRIRMDSPDPLLWDLLWLGLFGLVPLAAGLLLRRRPQRPGSGPRGALTASLLLTAGTLSGGYVAALPPDDLETFVVVMRPGADAGDLLDGLARVGGGILWAGPRGKVWTVRLDRPGGAALLYRHGAILVTGSPAALGCAAWTQSAG